MNKVFREETARIKDKQYCFRMLQLIINIVFL